MLERLKLTIFRGFQKFSFCQKRRVKKQFELLTKLSLMKFIDDLNLSVGNSIKLKTVSKIAFYKGVNNLFFVNHFVEGILRFVTKVSSSKLAVREKTFFEWQQKNINSTGHVAPSLLFYKEIESSNLSYLTMEYLVSPQEYTPDAIIDLYKRIGQLTQFLPSLVGHKNQQNLYYFELEANTKITTVIKNIVMQLHQSSGYTSALNFMNKREGIFRYNQSAFVEIKKFLSDSECITDRFDYEKNYGLLHGDFKNSNILCDRKGLLKVVDLQYYTYGARLWDLAFFCSKEKSKFRDVYQQFISPLKLDRIELRIFVLLYIIAVLLHVNQINCYKRLSLYILPAISFYKKLNVTRALIGI